MRSSANTRGAPRTSDALDAQSLTLRVTTAAQASARDQAAIAAGTPSFSLMLNAGTRSAEAVLRDFAQHLSHGVAVFAGAGNNGGDAYIVAAQLARVGVRVRLVASAPPRTPDAQRAAGLALSHTRGPLTLDAPRGDERLCIDGLLGTGHHGDLRADIATHTVRMNAARRRGAAVVALDVPTGVDATSGAIAADAARADCTLTYGTIKRGLLIARSHVGRLQLLDIGLGEHARGEHTSDEDGWQMASTIDIATCVPQIAWNAHKGTRGHLALVGGASGMAGAIVLATRAALASGIGLAYTYTDPESVPTLQQTVPQAVARHWTAAHNGPWAHALAIGPGLGRTTDSVSVLRRALEENPTAPVVLDADALTVIASGSERVAERLRAWCGDERRVVCTPHAGEFARLTGVRLTDDWSARAKSLQQFADASRATVLLKGAPTLVASPNAPIVAVPRGSAVLASGGSGDLLTGIIGTMLAQGASARDAALIGATVHGIAAERVSRLHPFTVRGATLDDVLRQLPGAWTELCGPQDLSYGVLCELPAVDNLR